MRHLDHILEGLKSVVRAYLQSGRPYIYGRNGFYVDRKALSSDVNKIKNDVQIAVKKYGYESSASTCYK
jgi:hypothetical protein